MRITDGYLEDVLAGKASLLLDGAMGTMIQQAGLMADVLDTLCISNPEGITAIQRQYVEAGSQAIITNTFSSNSRKLGSAEEVERVYAAAVACARAAGARYVAADIGPLGYLLDPLGDMLYEEAYELFAEQARAIQKTDADFVIIETMADIQEIEAAVNAVHDNCDLPVFASMTFRADGRTYLGCSVEAAVEKLEALGVDVLGANCSVTPIDMQGVAKKLLDAATCPVIIQANAGTPEIIDGKPIYTITPESYARDMQPIVDAGVRILGGCCGTNPAFIAELAKLLD